MEPSRNDQPSLEDGLKGFCVIADACVAALTSLPNEQNVSSMDGIARALGYEEYMTPENGAELEQRFYDRFFVPTHPAFVPLYEDSVRGGREVDGSYHYGKTDGRRFEHVLRCYQEVDFDFSEIQGFDLAVKRLKPDSFASELAFLSSLAAGSLESEDACVRERCRNLFVEFAEEHPERWFGAAVECLCRYGSDYYAGVCTIAAQAVSEAAGLVKTVERR